MEGRLQTDGVLAGLQINPSSSVLRCYLGMALAKGGEPDQALQVGPHWHLNRLRVQL